MERSGIRSYFLRSEELEKRNEITNIIILFFYNNILYDRKFSIKSRK